MGCLLESEFAGTDNSGLTQVEKDLGSVYLSDNPLKTISGILKDRTGTVSRKKVIGLVRKLGNPEIQNEVLNELTWIHLPQIKSIVDNGTYDKFIQPDLVHDVISAIQMEFTQIAEIDPEKLHFVHLESRLKKAGNEAINIYNETFPLDADILTPKPSNRRSLDTNIREAEDRAIINETTQRIIHQFNNLPFRERIALGFSTDMYGKTRGEKIDQKLGISRARADELREQAIARLRKSEGIIEPESKKEKEEEQPKPHTQHESQSQKPHAKEKKFEISSLDEYLNYLTANGEIPNFSQFPYIFHLEPHWKTNIINLRQNANEGRLTASYVFSGNNERLARRIMANPLHPDNLKPSELLHTFGLDDEKSGLKLMGILHNHRQGIHVPLIGDIADMDQYSLMSPEDLYRVMTIKDLQFVLTVGSKQIMLALKTKDTIKFNQNNPEYTLENFENYWFTRHGFVPLSDLSQKLYGTKALPKDRNKHDFDIAADIAFNSKIALYLFNYDIQALKRAV